MNDGDVASMAVDVGIQTDLYRCGKNIFGNLDGLD